MNILRGQTVDGTERGSNIVSLWLQAANSMEATLNFHFLSCFLAINDQISEIKGEVFPVYARKAYREVEVHLHSFLTSAIDGMSCERHASAAPFPGNNPGPQWIGGWVGPRAGLVISEKMEFLVNGMKVCGRVWV